MADRTADFGKLAFKVRFKVVAPQEAKPSITDVLVRCYGQFVRLENSLDHYTTPGMRNSRD
jgi:hypothetical protein